MNAEARALAQLRGEPGDTACRECKGGGVSDAADDGVTYCECSRCDHCARTTFEEPLVFLGPANAKGKRFCDECALEPRGGLGDSSIVRTWLAEGDDVERVAILVSAHGEILDAAIDGEVVGDIAMLRDVVDSATLDRFEQLAIDEAERAGRKRHGDEPTHDSFGRRIDYREREDLPGAER